MTKIQMITADGFQTSKRFYALPKIFLKVTAINKCVLILKLLTQF